MKKRILALLGLTSVALVASALSFKISNNIQPKEVTADDLPEDQLYFAPADVTINPPHTYTNSPTNEPWYKNSHPQTSHSISYERNMKTTVFDRMNVLDTWQEYRGENVKVAVIDTGCFSSHDDFVGTNFSLVSKNMVSGTTGISAVDDTAGHGTTSAAMVAAAINGVGGSGIAPNVELIVLKCVNSNNVFVNDSIKSALDYCIANKVDVINMSIQGYDTSFDASWVEDYGNYSTSATSTGLMSSSFLDEKIDECYENGITVVAAAGNYNTNRKSYPAANDHVIAVASTGLTEENKYAKAGYSNYGDWIDICAPGYVYTPMHTGTSIYGVWNGTSFSSPLVAGAIALYKSKYPNATPDQIEGALKESAHEIDWDGGAGAIDVDAFLAIAPDKTYVKSVALPESTKTINVGATYQLVPTVLPAEAEQSVLYSSSDTSICTVSDTGLVTGKAKGSATITVKSTENENKKATVTVTVNEVEAELYKSIVFTSSTMQGETQAYANCSFTNISDGITTLVENGNNNKKEWSSVKFGSSKQETTGIITNQTAIDHSVTKIVMKLDACASVKNAHLYVSSSSDFTNATDIEFTPVSGNNTINISSPIQNGYYKIVFDMSKAASNGPVQLSKIDFYGVEGPVAPTDVSLASITVSGQTTTYSLNSSFSFDGICRATYSDNSTKTVTPTSITSPDMTTSGDKIITVSYTEDGVTQSTAYTITVGGSTPTPTPGEYYKNVDTTSQTTLTTSLHNTISANTVDVGYDGLWEAYKKTDTKPGTNYYWDMYSDYNYTSSSPKSGYHGEGDAVNREHTVPQSWFEKKSPMKSDLFHVYPTDGYVNNRRSDNPHGDVGNATWNSSNGSKLGSASFSGISGTVFEVIDEYKGDFARSYFYMATRYSDKVGSWSGGLFTGTMPFMQTKWINQYYAWHIADPVSEKEINRNEAVYSIQKNRNPYIDHPEWVEYAFKGIKPEEEEPELSSISLSGDYTTTFLVNDTFSYSGLVVTAHYTNGGADKVITPTSVSSPTMSSTGTKTITVSYTEGEITKTATYNINVNARVVHNVSITSKPTTLDLYSGSKTGTITVSIDADQGADTSVTWTSSNTSVAKIAAVTGGEASAAAVNSSATITAVGAGKTTITAKAGTQTASYELTVSDSTPHATGVSLDTISATLNILDTLPLNPTITPDDAINKNVTWSSSDSDIASVSDNGLVTANRAGSATITVTTVDGGHTATCDITVRSSSETAVNEAKEWAIYFINKTTTTDTCKASTDEQRLTGLKGVWSELESGYVALSNDAKTAFCTNSNEKIKEALQHYQFIISKFNKDSTQLEDFVVDGKGNRPASSSRSLLNTMFSFENTGFIVAILSIIGVASIAGFVLYRKRKMY